MSNRELLALTCPSWQGGRPQLYVLAENAWNFETRVCCDHEDEDSTASAGNVGDGEYHSEDEDSNYISDYTEDSNASSGGDSNTTRDYLCLANTGELLEYIDEHFLCNECHSKPSLMPSRKGLATSLEINCDCPKSNHENLLAIKLVGDTDKRAIRSYPMNFQYILAMQYCGLGYSDAEAVAGIMGMHDTFSRHTWTKLEKELGEGIIGLCDEIVDKNIKAEYNASPVLEDAALQSTRLLTASYDMGWNGRGFGNNYNSNSGHAAAIGVLFKKMLGYSVKAKGCSTCTAWEKKMTDGILSPAHNCTANHKGSSKSMEAIAAVDILTKVAENGMAIRKVVGDDDTSFKANIRHSWKEKLEDPLDPFSLQDWPKTKSGNKKKDNGKLPKHVAEVLECLADPSHRTRTHASPYYEQARKTKANNPYGFNKNDMRRD